MTHQERLPFSIFQKCREWQSFDPGLERVSHVLNALENPHGSYPHILVGGTNGKGTVSYNLALNAPGPCGLFLSPHVQDIRERITLAGEWLPDDLWEAACLKVYEAVPEPDLSYFEWLLVLAVVMFHMKACAHAVFEVGLGGRLDATNALDPDLSILTNVSLDHTAILGDTVEQIAAEKIEIARRGKPFLCPKSIDENEEIEARLNEIGCLRQPHWAKPGFQGNDQVVTAALDLLDWKRSVPLKKLPARRDILRDGLYMDGAHNHAGWRDMVAWVRELTDQPVNVLCSLSQGRDPQEFLETVRPLGGKVYVWNVQFEKVLPLDRWPEEIVVVEDADLTQLIQDKLLVCGSLYMAGLFKKWLG